MTLTHGGGISDQLRLHANTNGCWVPFYIQSEDFPSKTEGEIAALIETEEPWTWRSPLFENANYEVNFFIFSGIFKKKKWVYRTCYPDARLEKLLEKIMSISIDSGGFSKAIRFQYIPEIGFQPGIFERQSPTSFPKIPPHCAIMSVEVSDQATVDDLWSLIQRFDYYRVQTWALKRKDAAAVFVDASHDTLPEMEAVDMNLDGNVRRTRILPHIITYPDFVSNRIQNVSTMASSVFLSESSRPVCILVSPEMSLGRLANQLFICRNDDFSPIFVKVKRSTNSLNTSETSASAVCEGVSTNLYSYGPFGDLTNEVQNGTAIARSYDAFGRPTGYALGDADGTGGAGGSPAATGTEVEYAYDAFGRFASVTSGTNVFAYSYLPGTRLVSGMTANTGHAWERIYESNRDLIATVHNRYGDRTISRFDYVNDEIGRRIARVDFGEAFEQTAFERYAYNARSELIGAHRFYGSDVTDESRPVHDRSFEYAYDPIGNRISSTEERNGAPVVMLYESNKLNQHTQTSNDVSEFVFEYDDDGNMTFDGQFRYSWNGENRMVQAEEFVVASNHVPVVVTYAYDNQGRMVFKNVSATNVVARSLLWNGYNIILEMDNGVPTYNTWGLDLDGILQGCGGVGGLVFVAKTNGFYVAFYDANGNVSAFLAETGLISARFEYSPYGKPLVGSGSDSVSSHQFSTKQFCPVTGLIEYQFRIYNPSLGRWTSRDPIEEEGSLCLFSFAENQPLQQVDYLGNMPHIAGGAIFGCAAGATYSLLSRLFSRESFCQCSCKAVGGCVVGGLAGAIGAAVPQISGCLIGLAGSVANTEVSNLCDGLCGKSGDEVSPVCIATTIILDTVAGCLTSHGAIELKGTESFLLNLVSSIVGFDITLYCDLLDD